MNETERASNTTRAVALKYLTIGLLLGLFFAPRAGTETWARVVANFQDLFGSLGGNEFAEPQ